MSAAPNHPRIDRLAMIGRRIRSGQPFWDALRAHEGSLKRLAERVGVASQTISYWKSHGGVTEERIPDLAQALDIPEHWIPRRSKPNQLRSVGNDVIAGVPFFEALVRHKACRSISRLLGLQPNTTVNWHYGIPKKHIQKIAKACACPEELLPVSIGPWRTALSENQKRKMVEGRGQRLRKDRTS